MLIDLHTYSRPSGGPPADKAAADARAAGLDAVLFADREASAASARSILKGEFEGIGAFVGVEIATRGGDAILIVPDIDPFYTREEWRELSAFGRPTLEAVLDLADREGGVVLLVHPYDRNRKSSPRDRMFAHDRVAGVEVGTSGADPRSNQVALEAVSHAPVPAFGGSAAKVLRPTDVRWATLLDAPVATQRELVERLKAGNFWAVEVFAPGMAPRPEHRHDDRGPRHDDRGPRRDDRGPRHDDRGPRHEGRRDDRGPRHDDRGPRHDDRGPRHEGRRDDRGPRRDDRGPRRDDRGPRPEGRHDDRGPRPPREGGERPGGSDQG